MLHLPANIKKIRGLSRLTQSEFAESMNVSLNMQKSYESGKAKPDIVYLARLEKYSGVSQQDLLDKDLGLSDIKVKDEKVEKVEEPVATYHKTDKQEVLLDIIQQLLAQNQKVIDSHSELSLANKIHGQNVRDLIAKLPATGASVPESPSTVEQRFQQVLFAIAKVGSGTRWKTEKEALAELNNIAPLPGESKS